MAASLSSYLSALSDFLNPAFSSRDIGLNFSISGCSYPQSHLRLHSAFSTPNAAPSAWSIIVWKRLGTELGFILSRPLDRCGFQYDYKFEVDFRVLAVQLEMTKVYAAQRNEDKDGYKACTWCWVYSKGVVLKNYGEAQVRVIWRSWRAHHIDLSTNGQIEERTTASLKETLWMRHRECFEEHAKASLNATPGKTCWSQSTPVSAAASKA